MTVMPYRGLADFLEALGHAGELARVEAEVDPGGEAAEVTRRIAAAGGPALIFRRVTGSDTPLVANLLGTEARIARALGGRPLDEIAARVADLADPNRAEGWLGRLAGTPGSGGFGVAAPRKARSGPAQQVVRLGRDVDLGELPLVQAGTEETAPAITAATLVCADPSDESPRAVRCDLVQLGPDRLAACWAESDEPARLLHEYRRLGEPMPVAAVLGGDPALALAAAPVLGARVDVLAVAGLLRERPLEVVRGRSVGLEVPADAEIVIEGRVEPGTQPVDSGRRCGPLGHLVASRPVPVVQVTAVTHRANPIFPAMVPGPPPHEACVVTRTMARLFAPLVKLAVPELVDFDLPLCGGARHVAFLSIRKTHPGQPRRVAMAAWAQRVFEFAKLLIMVDEGVDVRDPAQVIAAMAAHAEPGRDVFSYQGPGDPLDHAAAPSELAHRTAIDATAKLSGERAGVVPVERAAAQAMQRQVTDRWTEYGLGPEP